MNPPLHPALATPPPPPPPRPRSYPYVISGYSTGGTYRRCARALFELHAETFNAWTMIWGCWATLLLLWRAHAALSAAGAGGLGGGGGDRWRAAPDVVPFALMSAAVLLHAPWSVGFHLFRGMVRSRGISRGLDPRMVAWECMCRARTHARVKGLCVSMSVRARTAARARSSLKRMREGRCAARSVP